MCQLPIDGDVNVSKLSSVFSDRTNSYKFLWLKGILHLVAENNFKKIEFGFDEIINEMLVFAWHPNEFYKLSFGYWDKTNRYLEKIKVNESKRVSLVNIRRWISNEDNSDAYKHIERYVPYRFISVWFTEELRGIEDEHKNKEIKKLANEKFDCSMPVYKINDRNVVIHKKWMSYIQQNQSILKEWVDFHWANYLQKMNPTIPAVLEKISYPEKRASLNVQRGVWKDFISNKGMKCIYSGMELTKDDISLDHFIPWSYVSHDELWNLIPVTTTPNINSSKGNTLPSLDYLKKMLDAQYEVLKFSHEFYKQKKWKNIVSSYGVALRADEQEILKESFFKKNMGSIYKQQIENAERIGFKANWEYLEVFNE